MTVRSLDNVLYSYIESLHPIIYVQSFNFRLVDEALKKAVGDDALIIEYSNAYGYVRFENKKPPTSSLDDGFIDYESQDQENSGKENQDNEQPQDLYQFLKSYCTCGLNSASLEENFRNTVLLLKDVHNQLSDPRVIAMMREFADNMMYNPLYRNTIVIVSDVVVIPKEIESYISVVDVPLPSRNDIIEIVQKFIKTVELELTDDFVSDLALSLKGLNEHQILQVLRLAYQDGGTLSQSDKKLILREKEQFIKKGGMLELITVKETKEQIGGLSVLKEWLSDKSVIFENLDRAIKFGVQEPKGVMIVGMPGCGKSLTAKVCARMFELPLVRLDVGRLMGKFVGESENNMRNALKLAEAISPCVMWIDEIEKAFSGIGSNSGGGEVTTRLFGQLLTWMQEKEGTVFIVATANNISALPPEFMRKGRFDEVFFVDLPTEAERRMILDIHLRKRRKWHKRLDIASLAKETEGFCGADLESVINRAIEKAFIAGASGLTKDGILDIIKDTQSISSMLGPKIQELRDRISELKIKNASTRTQESDKQQDKVEKKAKSDSSKN